MPSEKLRSPSLLAAIVGGAIVATPALAQDPEGFVGTWSLVRIEVEGKPHPSFGARPVGQIYYDAGGRMAAQIMPDRPRPSWPSGVAPSPDQAAAAIAGYVAYFGTYAVDTAARTVSHHREGALNFNAPDFVRRYEFSPDGGMLSLVPVDNPRMRLVWQRLP